MFIGQVKLIYMDKSLVTVLCSVYNRNHTAVMLQAVLKALSYLLLRPLAQQIPAVSVCLWLFFTRLKALLEVLAFLSKTKTAPVLLVLVAVKTIQQ